VIPEQYNPLLDEKEIFNFLESRYGKLTGICITGGEPTLQKDCDKFISHMKALGFDVKLDTNGSNPKMLEKIIKDGDVDYIAMDIKSSLNKYNSVISTHPEPTAGWIEGGEKSQQEGTKNSPLNLGGVRGGIDSNLIKNIQKSINLIMNSGIPYEFRTTICHPLHEVKDFYEIGEMIKGADKYFIQNFVKSKHIDNHSNYTPFNDSEIEEVQNIMTQYVKGMWVR
jgi:pyruvate formate lyase activating enzyme